jgi:hypothetical protein
VLVINHYKPENKKVGIILILIGLVGSIILIFFNFMQPLLRLGLIGLGSFTLVLFGAYYLNEFPDFGCGEFRKAITISILAVFFASLAMGDQIVLVQDSILGQVFNNYWAILSTVIAFYFASRVLDNQTNGENKEEKPESGSEKQ